MENYKRIKQEEAAARAQLLAPSARNMDPVRGSQVNNSEFGGAVAHRRNASLLGQKYKPSEHAMA